MSRNISQHMLVRMMRRSLFFLYFCKSFGSSGPSVSSLFHQQECQYLLLCLCTADEYVVAVNSSSSVSLFVLFCFFLIGALAPSSGLFEYFIISLLQSENESFSAVYKEFRTLLSIEGDKLQGRFYITIGEFVSNLELILTTCTSRNQVR